MGQRADDGVSVGVAAPYGADVAQVYDLLVHGRQDAEADEVEMQFLRRAFRQSCRREVADVLDAGCGTGCHLVPLAREGYRVVGVDQSAAMVEECARKLRARGLSAELVTGDMASGRFREGFDAVLCMDSAICYLASTERILEALRAFRRALRPGGVLVVDNLNFLAQWHRWGVPYSGSCAGADLQVEYQDRHWYDDFLSLYHIELCATVRQRGRSWEVHNEDVLRVMTAGEMAACLGQAGFEDVSAYPDFDPALWREPCGERMVFLACRLA
jgi:SAM-dependent methyltransferase